MFLFFCFFFLSFFFSFNQGTATPRPSTAPPRVKPEAEQTAFISQGVRMRPIVEQEKREADEATPRIPRVKVRTSSVLRFTSLLARSADLPASSAGLLGHFAPSGFALRARMRFTLTKIFEKKVCLNRLKML